MATHEQQGSGYDPGAAGHEQQGRSPEPPTDTARLDWMERAPRGTTAVKGDDGRWLVLAEPDMRNWGRDASLREAIDRAMEAGG